MSDNLRVAGTGNLVFLDVLRATAVIGVVTVHNAVWALSNVDLSNGVLSAAATLFASGRLGVEVFFFLSGFLLSMLYEGSSKSLSSYAAARFFRIWPLWILFGVVWACYFLFAGEPLDWILTGLLLSVFFMLWASPSHFDSFIGGAWSIQIEIVSYVIFWFLRGKSLTTIVAIAIAINLIGTLTASVAPMDDLNLLSAIRRLSLQTGFNFFVFGWIASRISRDSGWLKGMGNREQNGIERAQIIKELATAWIFLMIWIVTFLVTPAYYGNPVEAIGFVMLSMFIAGIATRGKKVARVLGYVGRRSYFVFFAHFLLLELMHQTIAAPGSPAQALLVTPIAVTLILSISLLFGELSFRSFERPLMKFARRF